MNAASRLAEKIVGHHATSTPTQPQGDPNKRMKALCWTGKYRVEIQEKPKPMIVDPRDALIRITATTICGSDLHLYDGTFLDMHPGDILGHECMGIVEEVGSEVTKIKPGMRVVNSFDIACGQCEYCQKGLFTACDTTNPSNLQEKLYGHRTSAMLGYSHLTGGIPGGQAEWIRIPFADINCLPVPDELPDEKALYLSDIVPTSYFGTELGGVKRGSTVAVWGLGPVGLLICRWSQIKGASTIIGIDCIPERLEKARSHLGINTINFKEENVKERIDQICPGGVEIGIEAAGPDYPKSLIHKIETTIGLEADSCDIISEMIYCVKKFGTVSIIGAYSGLTNHFPIGALMEKGQTMNGGQCPTQRYWPVCLEKLRSGEMDPTFVVSHKGTLLNAPELYKEFFKKENGVMKVFLRPEGLPL